MLYQAVHLRGHLCPSVQARPVDEADPARQCHPSQAQGQRHQLVRTHAQLYPGHFLLARLLGQPSGTAVRNG